MPSNDDPTTAAVNCADINTCTRERLAHAHDKAAPALQRLPGQTARTKSMSQNLAKIQLLRAIHITLHRRERSSSRYSEAVYYAHRRHTKPGDP
jgi:hypothetical protein